MKQRAFSGEITAFLSLIFILILALTGTLIQSASIHITKTRKRADMELALQNVFAEYHKKALEEYDIFIRVGKDEAELSRRLQFYGAENMEHHIQKIQLLSDGDGQAFYEQAIRAMGTEPKEEGTFETSEWSVEEEEQEAGEKLEDILSQEGQEMPEENNPISAIKKLREKGLLTLIVPKEVELSERVVDLSDLPTHRTLETGSSEFGSSHKQGAKEKMLFTAYLTEHFEDYSKKEGEHSLQYEVEYLLEGKESDRANLEAVARKILLVRVATNYAYLLTDNAKKVEVEALAAVLSTLLTIPGALEVVKQVLLFSWAYGESIVDMRGLLKGKRLPVVKTEETWQLQLSNLAKLGTEEEVAPENEGAKGMSYQDYLKVFLTAESLENLCMRALDLLELNLQIKVDDSVTALEMKSMCRLPRGIQDLIVITREYS